MIQCKNIVTKLFSRADIIEEVFFQNLAHHSMDGFNIQFATRKEII